MRIDLQQIINNPFAVNFAFFLGRIIPRPIGYPLCDLIGAWLATRRHSNIIQAVRANQWVARGSTLKKEALDKVVRETLQNNVRDLYWLYHYAQKLEETNSLFHLNSGAREVIERPEFAARGLMIAALHLSN